MDYQCLYLPIGVPTFHLESAQKEFDKSVFLLKSIDNNIVCPDEMLLGIDKLNAFSEGKTADFVIVQNVTFANGAFTTEIMRKFSCPAVLWTLREPVIDGGRLRLNSLTGAYSAANVMTSFNRSFEYIFGSPEEENTKKMLAAYIKAGKLKKALTTLNVLQIGHTPQGFGFGRAMDMDVATKFGANLLSIEARELIDMAKGYSDEDIAEYLADAGKRIVDLNAVPEKNVKDFSRLYKAYYEYVKKNDIGALSSRCWPDFFTAYGTPVCAVLAILNDLDVPSSCEADTYGAISMYMGQYLSGKPTFFGDPVSMNEGENTVTFWHCGTAACSLARTDTGAKAGVHCNRKIGPTLEFGCRAAKNATIFRIGKDKYGYFRMFLSTGEVLDKPQQFLGTSLVVKVSDAKNLVYGSVKRGWEPHFIVAMDDIKEEIKAICDFLDIEVEEF